METLETGQSQPVQVAVIGVGNMGQHHARILSGLKHVQLIGVSDLNLERGLATASQYHARFFENYRDLLPHVDAAIVAVPTRQHYEVGMACLQAGVHVLLEKPIAASVAEAEALAQAAARCRLILQVGHIERFNPTFASLTQVLDEEHILALEAHRMSPYTHRANDVSVVLDLMIHDLDLLLELANAPVIQLAAQGSLGRGQSLNYVTATLGFANGIVATLTASKITHRKLRRIVAHGQHSLTEADFLGNTIQIYRHGPANCGCTQPVAYRPESLIENVVPHRTEPLQAELIHFVTCVQQARSPFVGGEQAINALRLACQIEQLALSHPGDAAQGLVSVPGSDGVRLSH